MAQAGRGRPVGREQECRGEKGSYFGHYGGHCYSKKILAEGLLLLENGGDKGNSLLFRKISSDLLRDGDDWAQSLT